MSSLASRKTAKVIIYGWFGAQERHLAKYVSLYEKLGFMKENIISMPTPIKESITFTGWTKLREKAVLNKENYEKGAEIVHLFSGGVFPYHQMRTAIPNFKTNALIYDSGPFLPDSNLVARFVRESGIVHPMIAKSLPLASMFQGMWLLEGANKAKILEERGNFLETLSCEAPKLFLGGDRDRIVCPDVKNEVLEYIRNKKNSGPVTEQQWPETKHTLHFRDHPKSYEEIIDKFLLKSLSSEESSNIIEEVQLAA